MLQDVSGSGQAKLKAAKVLVIGAGGLGAPVLLYLAAAGIGTLGVIDDDNVSLSNLQRQIIHASSRIGLAQTQSAQQTLNDLHPHVKVMTHKARLTAANALDIIRQYEIVADGSDNFATRFLVRDACYLANKNLV